MPTPLSAHLADIPLPEGLVFRLVSDGPTRWRLLAVRPTPVRRLFRAPKVVDVFVARAAVGAAGTPEAAVRWAAQELSARLFREGALRDLAFPRS